MQREQQTVRGSVGYYDRQVELSKLSMCFLRLIQDKLDVFSCYDSNPAKEMATRKYCLLESGQMLHNVLHLQSVVIPLGCPLGLSTRFGNKFQGLITNAIR